MLSLLTASPRTNALSLKLVARLLNLPTPEDYDLLEQFMLYAQADAEGLMQFPLARQQYREVIPGSDTFLLAVKNLPVASITQILMAGDALDASEYTIEDGSAGLIRRDTTGWPSVSRGYGYLAWAPALEATSSTYTIDYWGGWLLPADDLVQVSTVSADGVTNTYADSAGGVPLLVAGDRIRVSGFSTAANNGIKTVVSRTASGIVVEETLTTEASPTNPITIICGLPGFGRLPLDIEQGILEQIRALYLERRWDLTGPRQIIVGDGTAILAQTQSGMSERARKIYKTYMRPTVLA